MINYVFCPLCAKKKLRKVNQLFRIMKMTSLFLAIACLHVSAASLSQTVTLKVKQEPITEVLAAIEAQTGYVIVYNDKYVKPDLLVSLNVKDQALETVLDKILTPQHLIYQIKNKTIAVRGGAMEVERELELPTILQTRTVSGRVTDNQGNPLADVTVSVKGMNTRVTSNYQGNYRITVPPKGTFLVFTFVGFESVEKVIENQSNIDILMVPSISDLDEVVVVGYGTERKEDLTGAISSLDAKDLNAGGTVSNVAQALRGRAAGVHVTQNSSAPGGSISIRIRGSNSISSGNDPLYVVDGFPMESGLDINPNDISNIQILKDASATAIYGSRGANGVVMITTKRGEAGLSRITYNAQAGAQQIKSPFDMLQGREYMELANDLFREIDGQEDQEYAVFAPADLESKVNTDWIKETMRLGAVQDHSLQASSGGENTKVYTSVGYFDQVGVLKNTNWKRFSGLVNVEQKITSALNSGASISGRREMSNVQEYEGNIAEASVLYMILNYSPVSRVYNDDGSFARPSGGNGDNPLSNLLARTNDVQTDIFNGSVFLEFKPIDKLTIRADAGSKTRRFTMGTYLPQSTFRGSLDGGRATLVNASANQELLSTFVTYEDRIAENHSLKVMGGYSWERFYGEYRTMNASGFSTDLFTYHNIGAAAQIAGITSSKNEHYLISFFGRLNYSAFDKYLFTFNMRRDGSSRFGKDNRWGIFPSGAVAWQLGREAFIQDLNIFSHLKLRFGIGVTGNERIGDYASFGLVSTSNYTFDGSTFTPGTILNPGTPANPKLKWETTTQYDLGLDAGLFDSRLQLTVDLYHKRTSDLLVNVPLPHYSGFVSGIKNSGAIENKGIELGIVSHNLTKRFIWDTGLVFSLNRNKVLNVGQENAIFIESNKPIGSVSNTDFAIVTDGAPLGSLYGYVYDGVIQQGEQYAPQPNSAPGDPKFKDISGPDGVPDGQITADDRTIIGNANPKFSYGISNSFTYKNFDLGVFVYGSVGNELLNMTRMRLEWQRTKDALNRWTPQNTNTDIPRNGFFYTKYADYLNSHFVEDASFLRVESVTLGYTFRPNRIFNSLRMFVKGQNLFLLTNYSGWDPEVSTKAFENDPLSAGQYIGERIGASTLNSNAGLGLDFNSYPTPKVFMFGLSATF